MRTPFLGGRAVARSLNAADNRLINLFPEMVETKDGKDVGAFYMCPGLDLLCSAGNGPIRGLHVSENRLHAVSGNQVYGITGSGVATLLGTISTGSGPVSMIDNGTQLAIFDGSPSAYYLTLPAGAPTLITLPFTGAVGTAAFVDGFGLINQAGTVVWWASAINDLSSWPGLSFASAGGTPDFINSIASIHREVWLFKTSSIEVWINAGLPNFVFQRLDGVFPETGCCAPASVTKMGDSLYWLAQSGQGQGRVMRSNGYLPERISTHEEEYAIAQLSGGISDAIGMAYQQEGHEFYSLTFPNGDLTLTYDRASQRWHQRAAFSNGQFGRHWMNCMAFWGGQNLVGDYRNGNIYAFNMNTLTDNTTARKWLRSWRALPKPVDKPVTFRSLSIDMETGSIPTPVSTNPLAVLRWSDDGGHNWSDERWAPVGPLGQTALRVKFNRLGSTRRNTGLDRIFELSSTDAFRVGLIGADLDAA